MIPSRKYTYPILNIQSNVLTTYRTLDALSQSLEECRIVLKRLYPSHEAQGLLKLDRTELLALLDRNGSQCAPSQKSPTGSNTNTSPTTDGYYSPMLSNSDDDRSLATLEQIPSLDSEWDEERRNRHPIPAEADDVNALSLSVDRQSSYLGATSIKAAFLVMLKVAPMLRSFLAPSHITSNKHANASNYPTPRPGNFSRTTSAILWSSEGQTLIDAYFNRVQIFIPMLDEPSFRADYLSGRRSDSPWLSLLNVIFAMGSIVARKSDDHSHITYYTRARDHLGIDSFGSGHLETLQALILMGGFYLHYINRPNMANAITGAALRMACAMGLHRESPQEAGNQNLLIFEQRRRTWWSLFCLDTWASTTLGRPSMGRWGPGISVQPPQGGRDPVSLRHKHSCYVLTSLQNVIGQHTGIIPLIENIKFCKIATQIQDVLAQTPLMRPEDRANLDRQLVDWYNSLPWILRSTEPCPESIYTARCVMKWRYQNLRIVLYRPVLLNLANRGTDATPNTEEIEAVLKCRALAQQNIEDIAREWTPNQMLGWNGVWFMYQASMIPLVSMFWEAWNESLVHECQAQIETVLDAFEGMTDWSLAARRSREVVSKMYDASKRPLTRQASPVIWKSAGTGIKGESADGGLTGHGSGNGFTMTLMRGVDGMNVKGTNGIHGMGMINGMQSHEDMTGMSLDDTHHPVQMIGEEGLMLLEPGVFDMDGMLWGHFPDGLDMPYDLPDMEYEGNGAVGYDGNYSMHLQ